MHTNQPHTPTRLLSIPIWSTERNIRIPPRKKDASERPEEDKGTQMEALFEAGRRASPRISLPTSQSGITSFGSRNEAA